MRWLIGKALLPSLTTELSFVSQFKTVVAQNRVMVPWGQRQESQRQSAGARPGQRLSFPSWLWLPTLVRQRNLKWSHCYFWTVSRWRIKPHGLCCDYSSCHFSVNVVRIKTQLTQRRCCHCGQTGDPSMLGWEHARWQVPGIYTVEGENRL